MRGSIALGGGGGGAVFGVSEGQGGCTFITA